MGSAPNEPVSHTIVGIDIEGVKKLNGMIDNWIDDIKKNNIQVSEFKTITSAIRGEKQTQEFKKLCQQCNSYTTTLLTKLEDYKARLNGVVTAYKKNDSSATAISNVTASLKKRS